MNDIDQYYYHRRMDAPAKTTDPLGAGTYLFSNREWRDASTCSGRAELAQGKSNLKSEPTLNLPRQSRLLRSSPLRAPLFFFLVPLLISPPRPPKNRLPPPGGTLPFGRETMPLRALLGGCAEVPRWLETQCRFVTSSSLYLQGPHLPRLPSLPLFRALSHSHARTRFFFLSHRDTSRESPEETEVSRVSALRWGGRALFAFWWRGGGGHHISRFGQTEDLWSHRWGHGWDWGLFQRDAFEGAARRLADCG